MPVSDLRFSLINAYRISHTGIKDGKKCLQLVGVREDTGREEKKRERKGTCLSIPVQKFHYYSAGKI